MVKKLTALDCIKESGCQDFETAFPRVTGYISECAKYDPDALYTATEVAELIIWIIGMIIMSKPISVTIHKRIMKRKSAYI
jgi:hypothetical protein